MKRLLLSLAVCLSLSAFGQKITVVQINADWNSSNTRKDLSALQGCKYVFGWLEDQTPAVKKNVTSVPTVIIYKDGKPVKICRGDISLKLDVTFDDIQKQVWAIKED